MPKLQRIINQTVAPAQGQPRANFAGAEPRLNRIVPNVRTTPDDFGASAFREVGKAGEVLLDAEIRRQKSASAVKVANVMGSTELAIKNAEIELAKDPDPDTYVDRFTEKLEEIRESALAQAATREESQAIELQINKIGARALIQAQGTARALDIGKQKATTIKSLDIFERLYSQSTTEADKIRHRNMGVNLITTMAATAILNQPEAEKMTIKFLEDLEYSDARVMAGSSPARFLQRAEAGAFQRLSAVQLQQLQEFAERRLDKAEREADKAVEDRNGAIVDQLFLEADQGLLTPQRRDFYVRQRILTGSDLRLVNDRMNKVQGEGGAGDPDLANILKSELLNDHSRIDKRTIRTYRQAGRLNFSEEQDLLNLKNDLAKADGEADHFSKDPDYRFYNSRLGEFYGSRGLLDTLTPDRNSRRVQARVLFRRLVGKGVDAETAFAQVIRDVPITLGQRRPQAPPFTPEQLLDMKAKGLVKDEEFNFYSEIYRSIQEYEALRESERETQPPSTRGR